MNKKQTFPKPGYTRPGKRDAFCLRGGGRISFLIMVVASLFTFVLVLSRPAFAGEKVFGHQQNGKALVYLIRQKGKQRHVFANERWLGVVPEDAYTFSYLDPGEHLLWNDRGRYELVFLSSAQTYYFELEGKRLNQLSEVEGLSALQAVGSYVAANEEKRRQGLKKFGKFKSVQWRATYEGAYKPCLFAEAKRAEYERLAKLGDVSAQHDIATMYWSGECIDQDRNTGLHWHQMAAQNGHGLSALLLGNIYAKGISVPEDAAQAGRWYRIAAEHGQRDYHRLYAAQWLEQNDEEYQEVKRLRDQAAVREAVEKEKQREQRERQRQLKRLATVESKFGHLGIAVESLASEVRLEQPRRKKPEEAKEVNKNRGDNEVTYMLPPEIALGVLAVGWVIGAIESAMESQLSGADKQQIKQATDQLSLAFADRAVARELRQRIVDSAQLPSGRSLYTAVDYEPAEPGAVRYQMAPVGVEAIVEVETMGMGIVLSEKRYRPARFVMANQMRVIRRTDGSILRQAPLCYASRQAHNFSDWASDDVKRLRTEVETAYARIAQDVLMILADEKDSAGTTEAMALCAKLKQTIDQYREQLGGSGRR